MIVRHSGSLHSGEHQIALPTWYCIWWILQRRLWNHSSVQMPLVLQTDLSLAGETTLKLVGSMSKSAEGDYLQYICSMWLARWDQGTSLTTPIWQDNISHHRTSPPIFTINMSLFWSETDDLHFRVCRKENHLLEYLNKGKVVCTLDPSSEPGVTERLTKLTTVTEDNRDLSLPQIYPIHFAKLEQAELLRVDSMDSTLGEEQEKFQTAQPS